MGNKKGKKVASAKKRRDVIKRIHEAYVERTGETVGQASARIRLEKAAKQGRIDSLLRARDSAIQQRDEARAQFAQADAARKVAEETVSSMLRDAAWAAAKTRISEDPAAVAAAAPAPSGMSSSTKLEVTLSLRQVSEHQREEAALTRSMGKSIRLEAEEFESWRSKVAKLEEDKVELLRACGVVSVKLERPDPHEYEHEHVSREGGGGGGSGSSVENEIGLEMLRAEQLKRELAGIQLAVSIDSAANTIMRNKVSNSVRTVYVLGTGYW